MSRRRLVLLSAATLAASTAMPAAAQSTSCEIRERMLMNLARNYGETRQSIGLDGSGSLMELFASRETGTWTIIKTLPNGLTCMIGSGESFETIAEEPDSDPA
ncbi:hypothetical protein [Pukyongiella litopenaei]|uniref:Uncharacterized protein n=1 Tax=Pukyongiella litopenaei TaxID=2605946 RepID=A0A2S0ML41_9RHOB|nr:hypothetical protein [Pukyongiella litopenaei]AVO36582.1 hypothetical protein C6Y53_01950 [Pukyongiella litopenaei]